MKIKRIRTLAEELKLIGRVIFVYEKKVYTICEHKQGEDSIKYKINVYGEKAYRKAKESGKELKEKNSRVYVGTALQAIALCFDMENTIPEQKTVSIDEERPKCFICGADIKKKSAYDQVCSPECAKLKVEYNSIDIPKPFVKRVTILTHDEKERTKKITDFANRHGYDISLCAIKIERLRETI